MYTSLLIATVVLVLAVVGLVSLWFQSGWRSDRRNALAKIDRFVNNLNVLSEDFPGVSAQLNLPKLNDAWAHQRAEIVSAGGFVAWVKEGLPSSTVNNPKADALFRFARSKAEPISYSIDRVVDAPPSNDLISRIKAVIDPHTGRLMMDTKSVRLVQAAKMNLESD